MIRLIITERDVSVFHIVLLLTSSFPFLFFNFDWHPYKFVIAFSAIVLTVILLKNISLIHPRLPEWVMISSVCLTWVLSAFHFDTHSLQLLFHVVIAVIIFLILSRRQVFERFVNLWFLILFWLSLLAFLSFIASILGWVSQQPIFPRPGLHSQMIYLVGASFTNSVHWILGSQIPRVAGPFDEPGQLAVVVIYLYIFSHLLHYPSKTRYALIASGLSTASLAFIVTLPFLLLLSLIIKKNRLVRPASFNIFINISILTLLLSAIFFTNLGSEYFSRLVLDRLSDYESIAQGENRADSFSSGIKAFVERPWLGVGKVEYDNNYGNAHSIMGTVGSFGILGLLSILLPFLLLVYLAGKRRSVIVLLMLFIVLLNFIHRPPSIGIFSAVMNYTFFVLCLDYIYWQVRPQNWEHPLKATTARSRIHAVLPKVKREEG
jgi:hypothetical protein